MPRPLIERVPRAGSPASQAAAGGVTASSEGESLQAAAAKAALIERRRSHRTRARSTIILIVDEDGRTLSRATTTFDVSASGARVGVGPKLTVGQSVKIILHDANQEFMPCRVVWVGTRPEGAREAGLEFLHDRALAPKATG